MGGCGASACRIGGVGRDLLQGGVGLCEALQSQALGFLVRDASALAELFCQLVRQGAQVRMRDSLFVLCQAEQSGDTARAAFQPERKTQKESWK